MGDGSKHEELCKQNHGYASCELVSAMNQKKSKSTKVRSRIKASVNEVVLTSSLDREMEGEAQIDLLTVHVSGLEVTVLRGARELLQAGRISCVFSFCFHSNCQTLETFLNAVGYITKLKSLGYFMDQFEAGFIAASPEASVRDIGC